MRVRGNQLPRTVFGRFYILCAILRQLVLAFSILYYDRDTYDVIIIDQLSACIPLFKLFSSARVKTRSMDAPQKRAALIMIVTRYCFIVIFQTNCYPHEGQL